MTKKAELSAPSKKLSAELSRAETFVADSIGDHLGSIPATLLVIFKQRLKYMPRAFSLFDVDELELSIMADIRSNLRAAGEAVAATPENRPAYALSMIEIAGDEQAFWLNKGFFPIVAVPEAFIGKDTLLMTASDASGHAMRRLSLLIDSPLLLTSSRRQLGRSIQVELSEQASEMDLFWETFTASRARLIAEVD